MISQKIMRHHLTHDPVISTQKWEMRSFSFLTINMMLVYSGLVDSRERSGLLLMGEHELSFEILSFEHNVYNVCCGTALYHRITSTSHIQRESE